MVNRSNEPKLCSMWTSWSGRWAVIVGLACVLGIEARAQARLPTPEEAQRLDEGTALTLGGQTLKVGILAFDYGITDRINVGTDPPMWLIRTAEPVLVPNLHVMVIAYRWNRLWLTGQAAVYYASITRGDASGNLWTIPLTGYASYQIDSRWWVHGELIYNIIWGSGVGNLTESEIGGAAATRSFQIGATGEYRIRPTIAITLHGQVQLYTGRLALSGSVNPDAFTAIEADARITARNSHPWQVVPAVAFLWQRVRLTAGVGYGNYFVPGMQIALTKQSFVPEGSVSVVF
jgi:hypothetical protein